MSVRTTFDDHGIIGKMKMKSTHLRYEEDAGAYRTEPTLFVNGKRLPSSLSSRARPNQTLLDFLRVECKLTGSKLGCGEGGCGACTVLVSRLSGKGRVVHVAVNACLFPVLAADGCHVTTIGEGFLFLGWRSSSSSSLPFSLLPYFLIIYRGHRQLQARRKHHPIQLRPQWRGEGRLLTPNPTCHDRLPRLAGM